MSAMTAALPFGTVTFLFTDIEGSTQLWERYPTKARAALTRHDSIIEEITARHGGTVVRPRGEGDSRFAVFPRATDAVSASADIQRALYEEAWPSPISLRVRMALHTGEADLREGDYYGSDVNRCARLRAVAYGGQTLVSAATQILVRDSLSSGITLRDLGEHRLKDLQRPERVFQVIAPGIPADFPPLRSLGNIPNNLPIQLTSFVGREHEMEEVNSLLVPTGEQSGRATRLVTLTGAGGTGKTRLSLQVAADLLHAYPDGVWFVELAPVVDPSLVPQAVASALGVREAADSLLVESITAYLRPKSALLIFDNCEHLVDACADLVEMLLRLCPRLSVLATSREPLGIAGELPYRVPSLSLPESHQLPDVATLSQYEAVRLFLERARTAQGVQKFALTEQNAGAIAEICRRLDGIPLAIELAAARARVLSVEQIAARLGDQFRLLTGGSRTAMPRQQTLRAAIDWSYNLLSPEECTLLRRLSVFTGGWSLEAAEGVCAGDGIEEFDVLDLLTRLSDKSLVVVEQAPLGGGEVRYRMVETIRQYAADKLLDAGETAQARDRHLEFFLKMAEELGLQTAGPAGRTGLDRLRTDYDNLRAALEWSLGKGEERGGKRESEHAVRLASALSGFWAFRGDLNEGRRWLERAIALFGAADTADTAGSSSGSEATEEDKAWLALRAKVLQGAGTLAWRQADPELAQVWLEESVAIERKLEDTEDLAQSIHILGHALLDQLDFEGARSLFEESLSLFRRVGNKLIAPSLVGDLGVVAYSLGDYPAARSFLERSLAEYRELQASDLIAQQSIRLGDLARSEGDYEQALALYEECLERTRKAGSRLLIAASLHRLGQMARHQGDLSRASSLIKEGLTLHQEEGSKLGIAECLAALAGVASEESNVDRAAVLFGATDALLERIKVPLTPADREQYDSDLAAAKALLEEKAWEGAWVKGRGISIEQAVEYALAQTTMEVT
jgi:predicted ATPase/class 3 adenylate cyclase